MPDALFKTEDSIFSYRIAGICIEGGKILLQKAAGQTAFNFPGGHVALGETSVQTLAREFREEIGAEISVGALKWVGEIFFPWEGRTWQQICLYYLVRLTDGHTPRSGMFPVRDRLDGRAFDLEFHWVPLETLPSLTVYPSDAAQMLQRLDGGVEHFVFYE